jgi:hypothetical protein
MVILKFPIHNLRNAEYVQFISSACNIFGRFGVDRENLNPMYEAIALYLKDAETAIAIEAKNEKIREKNDTDRYRDRLHRKFFNYVKSILYDEFDPRFNAAQQVMRVIKEVGNPTSLAENAESAMIAALGKSLEPYRAQVIAIGATDMIEALMTANERFVALEIEARDITANLKMSKSPSMTTVRKQIDTVYRTIVDAINGYAKLPAKQDAYRELVTELNVLVEKYDAMLMQRKGNSKEVKS